MNNQKIILAWRNLFVGVCLILAVVANGQNQLDRPKYLKARKRLIQSESYLNPSSAIKLTEAEKAADSYLSELRKKELEYYKQIAGDENSFFRKNFLTKKTQIDQSPNRLINVFKKLPKGAVLHAHPGAIGDFRWLISYATYLPDCYIYVGPDNPSAFIANGSLAFFKSPPNENWKLVSDLRASAPDKTKFDEELYQSITLGPEDVSKPDIWSEFEKCFMRVEGLQSYIPVYLEYGKNELEEIAKENVQVLELRAFLGGPSGLDGVSVGSEKALEYYRIFADQTAKKHPGFQLKIIYTYARADSPERIAQKLKSAQELHKKYPNFVVGFDLVNEEDRSNALLEFLDGFLSLENGIKVKQRKLPFFFHAGESNQIENENLFDAILLNSKRIGHGLALMKHPLLLNLVKQRKIPVEVCPISNQVLGYIPDLRNHPAVFWLRSGIPITLNPDDPGMMGYTFSYDFYEAFMAWELRLADLKLLAMNSITYSSLNETEKKKAMSLWNQKWKNFIKQIVADSNKN